MDATAFFNEIFRKRAQGCPAGIYAVCSANPYVLRAAMEQSTEDGLPVLIEATANQVNQFGGYTGMKPQDFVYFVHEIAAQCGFPPENIILGGDHLGPLVWKDRDEPEAMALAEELVVAYVRAGFSKIHLDTSMKLASDSAGLPLNNAVIARRGARLCAAAEKACAPDRPPVYVIGSEVPTPGGPQEKIDTLAPTTPEAFLASFHVFRDVFAEAGLQDAFSRVVAFVVQPGVEFNGSQVFEYDRYAAAQLCAALGRLSGTLVFEGHSTDYQTPVSLRKLVEDGVAILKVGPALTFALRQALMALESMERELIGVTMEPSRFAETLEAAMLGNDSNWKHHYSGTGENLRLQLRYSFFDRARYYLPEPEVDAAIKRLVDNLEQTGLPIEMLSQYLPQSFERVRAGFLSPAPNEIIKDCIKHCLRGYSAAIN